MISSQILQNTIEGLKTIAKVDLCVMDTDGKSLATTFSDADTYGCCYEFCKFSGGQSGDYRMSVF